MMKRVYTRIDNVRDSIDQALSCISSKKRESGLKRAIIHLQHAIEIAIKEKLAKYNKLLIYAKPEQGPKGNTVTWSQGWDRLIHLGWKPEQWLREAIKKLADARNSIVHDTRNFNLMQDEEMVATACVAYESLVRSLKLHSLAPEQYLSEAKFRQFRKLTSKYDRRFKNAQIKQKAEAEKVSRPNTSRLCPLCYKRTTLFPVSSGDRNNGRCFYCETSLSIVPCYRCRERSIIIEKGDDSPDFCRQCYSEMENESVNFDSN